MTVHMHPTMDAHLDTARAIIKAPKGTYTRDQEDDAIRVLRDYGDFMDVFIADQFARLRMEDEMAKDYEAEMKKLRASWKRDLKIEKALHGLAYTLAVLAAAFLMAGVAFWAVTV